MQYYLQSAHISTAMGKLNCAASIHAGDMMLMKLYVAIDVRYPDVPLMEWHQY